jgi:hypothetical protein
MSVPWPPFSAWPIQCSDPEIGFAWYAGQGIIVTQITGTHGTARAATVLSDWIDELLDSNASDLAKYGGMLGIHDWRRVLKYDSAARKVWYARIHRRPKGYLRKAVVIVADNPLLKMAVAGANMAIAVASRGEGQIEVATNAQAILSKYCVTAPQR